VGQKFHVGKNSRNYVKKKKEQEVLWNGKETLKEQIRGTPQRIIMIPTYIYFYSIHGERKNVKEEKRITSDRGQRKTKKMIWLNYILCYKT